MSSGLLPEPFYHALRSTEGKVFVTADPFLAEALKIDTGYPYIQDIFTWASEKAKKNKPNPLDLLEAFDKALARIGRTGETYFPEHWAMAQRLGRDWQEVLWATSSLQEALGYWKALKAEKEIAQLFALYEKNALTWLQQLPLPLIDSSKGIFWENFVDFIHHYHQYLSQKNRLFAEEALQQVLHSSDMAWEKVVFLHVYSSYPLLEKVIANGAKAGAEVWRWDTELLSTMLPEVWDKPFPGTRVATWPDSARQVTIYERPSLIELLEEAAQTLAAWHNQNPEARIAVWGREDTLIIFQQFIEKQLPYQEIISAKPTALWESTQVGKSLQPLLLDGLAGKVRAWPMVSASEDPADQWAATLYAQVTSKMVPEDPNAWQFLFQLLQSRNPIYKGIFPQTRIYLGRLPQIAGGAYDALFLINPPGEFLGRWERVSFWPAGLRRRFFSPEAHRKLGWRLLSLLLWGSKNIFLWRLAGVENSTPIEDLLTHADSLSIAKYFTISPSPPNPPPPRLASQPLTPNTPLSASTPLSPSELSQLFICPRRFYWQKVLSERPASEAAEIGTLLHEIVGWAFRSRRAPHAAYEASLRKVAYRLSCRRLYYRLGRIRARDQQPLWKRKYKPLRPFMAQVSQPILHSLTALLYESAANPQKVLRFRHFAQFYHRLHFFSETPVSLPSPPIKGRIDLLIEAWTDPTTGEVLESPRRYLIDFKSSLSQDVKKLHTIPWDWRWPETNEPYTPPKKFPESGLQALIYLHALSKSGGATLNSLPTIVIINLWWRPKQEAGPDTLYAAFHPEGIQEYLNKLEQLISNIVPKLEKKSKEGALAFPQTTDHYSCRYCDFALLCDRLEV
ncbi:MAG: PD-(D/E)XK nuclease family protein [Bacteroidia bacterium]|nr:PD-(D/E)XK nuclease family protein [Bacteroidia bacterium]GIV22568.1 MAG: hypothetical protein KatS3mg025_0227 [Bacteroidia bacterium]